MSSPPGLVAGSTAALEARRGGGREDRYLSVQTLTAQGRKVLEARGESMSQNRLQRLVRRFISDGRADLDFKTWVIAHADPTGETAVRNVMRERGQR